MNKKKSKKHPPVEQAPPEPREWKEPSEAEYLRMALSFQSVAVTTFTADLILSTLEVVKRKKGQFSIKDAVDVKFDVEMRWETIRRSQEELQKEIKKQSKAAGA